jgi:hypothetical protein
MHDEVKRLPDPEVCRTRFLGAVLSLSKCLVASPADCPYALKFEGSFLCRHPDRRKFEKPASMSTANPPADPSSQK